MRPILITLILLLNSCSNTVTTDYDDHAQQCLVSPGELKNRLVYRVSNVPPQDIHAIAIDHESREHQKYQVTPGGCILIPPRTSHPILVFDSDRSRRSIQNPNDKPGDRFSIITLQTFSPPIFKVDCSKTTYTQGEWRLPLTYSQQDAYGYQIKSLVTGESEFDATLLGLQGQHLDLQESLHFATSGTYEVSFQIRDPFGTTFLLPDSCTVKTIREPPKISLETDLIDSKTVLKSSDKLPLSVDGDGSLYGCVSPEEQLSCTPVPIHELDTSALSGQYWLTAYAIDLAGNRSTELNQEVWFDHSPPLLEVEWPQDSMNDKFPYLSEATGYFPVKLSVSDDTSALHRIKMECSIEFRDNTIAWTSEHVRCKSSSCMDQPLTMWAPCTSDFAFQLQKAEVWEDILDKQMVLRVKVDDQVQDSKIYESPIHIPSKYFAKGDKRLMFFGNHTFRDRVKRYMEGGDGSYWIYGELGLYFSTDGVEWQKIPFRDPQDSSWHSSNLSRDHVIFNGELWLQTSKGLIRSTPQEAQLYEALEKVNSLDVSSNESIEKLFASNPDGLWEWNGDAFVKTPCDYSRYDTELFKQFMQGTTLDADGNLEYIILNQGVTHNCEYTPFPLAPNYQEGDLVMPYAVTRVEKNRFLLGTTDFLFSFEDGEFTLVADFREYHLPYQVHFTPLFIDTLGRYWIQWNSNAYSFLILDPRDKSWRNYSDAHLLGVGSSNSLANIVQSSTGRISFATKHGIYDWSPRMNLVDLLSTDHSLSYHIHPDGIRYPNKETVSVFSSRKNTRIWIDDYLDEMVLSPNGGRLLIGHDKTPNSGSFNDPKLYIWQEDRYQQEMGFSNFVNQLDPAFNIRYADTILELESGGKAVAFENGPIIIEFESTWQLLPSYSLPEKTEEKSLAPYSTTDFVAITSLGPVLVDVKTGESNPISHSENLKEVVGWNGEVFALGASGRLYQLLNNDLQLSFEELNTTFRADTIGYDDQQRFFAIGARQGFLHRRQGLWYFGETETWSRLANYNRIYPIGIYADKLWLWIPDKIVLYHLPMIQIEIDNPEP